MPLLWGRAVRIGMDAAPLHLLWLTPSKFHRLKVPSGRDLGGLCQHSASLGHVSEKCSLCQYRDVGGNSAECWLTPECKPWIMGTLGNLFWQRSDL